MYINNKETYPINLSKLWGNSMQYTHFMFVIGIIITILIIFIPFFVNYLQYLLENVTKFQSIGQ